MSNMQNKNLINNSLEEYTNSRKLSINQSIQKNVSDKCAQLSPVSPIRNTDQYSGRQFSFNTMQNLNEEIRSQKPQSSSDKERIKFSTAGVYKVNGVTNIIKIPDPMDALYNDMRASSESPYGGRGLRPGLPSLPLN